MVNWSNGAHYVGSTHNFASRRIAHKTELKTGRHTYTKKFLPALKAGTLTFFILQSCPYDVTKRDLWDIEQIWANYFPQRVNQYKTVSGLGKFTSTEQCKKNQQYALGNPGRRGQPLSPAHREKVRLVHTGRKRSPETCEKVRLAKLAYWQQKREDGTIKQLISHLRNQGKS